ncbi:F0F1 ATP synthase subunit B [Candidiatus Paracoxiella cheracis]|uniref:F0F1 ATP synthase subunit B n=1 Tax=Candidiatus Paracoxiella cheracis TaxID=3405120 RepID=UPI003BF5F9CD
MDINATLIVQMVVFVAFIWVTMRFIWPPVVKALEERRKKIADGLAAAEQGQKDLEHAQIKVKEMLTDAKAEASHIIEQANKRANYIIEESKAKAREAGEHLLELAKSEITQEYNAAKEKLMKQVSEIAVAGAERILQKEVDKASNDRLVDELVSEI